MIIRGNELQELELLHDLFDDFLLDPFHPRELEARIKHMLASSEIRPESEKIEYGPLVLDLETYEASVDGTPVDLTFMEYELLRFLFRHTRKPATSRGAPQQSLGLRVLRRRSDSRRSCKATESKAGRRVRRFDSDRTKCWLSIREAGDADSSPRVTSNSSFRSGCFPHACSPHHLLESSQARPPQPQGSSRSRTDLKAE